MSTFEDITVVDLDLKKTTWSRVHSSMRTLYLQLSREPDLEWIRYFNTERESRVVPTRHGMWIEEGYIIFDCLLQNVEPYHLPDFQKSIDYANERSRERVIERREERVQRRTEISEEHDVLASLRSKIRREEPDIEAPVLDAVVELPVQEVVESDPAPALDEAVAVVEETPVEPTPTPEPALIEPALAEPAPPPVPVAEKAANDDDDFDSRRNEWRSRFRQAMTSRKEPDGDKSQ